MNLPQWLRSLLCRHEHQFLMNLYGDQIYEWGMVRSVWKCRKCNALQGRALLGEK